LRGRRWSARAAAMAITVWFAALLCSAGPADAQTVLDSSFAADGIAATDLGNDLFIPDSARAVARQSDGKLVVAGPAGGITASTTLVDFGVARYDTNGAPDGSFGTGGIVRTPIGALANDIAWAVVVQSDGKIVAAGESAGNIALARYESNGSLDATFGGGGLVTTEAGGTDRALAIIEQTDNKLVVAGASVDPVNGDSELLIARYESNGTLDATFAAGGVLVLDVDGGNDAARAVVQQVDGKLVVAGVGTSLSVPGVLLARFDIFGAPDAGFAGGGVTIESFSGAAANGANDLALRGDGSFAAAGGVLAVFDSGGAIDGTFAGGGSVALAEEATALVEQSDGMLVVAGASTARRYDAGGNADSSFGNLGTLALPLPAHDLLQQPDGKLIFAGEVAETAGMLDSDFAVARYRDVAVPCPPTPLPGCRPPLIAGKSLLLFKGKPGLPSKDLMTWKWLKGTATLAGALGDPLNDTDYTLCVYDEIASVPSLVLTGVAAAGGTCADKPCWKALGKPPGAKGYKFKDKSAPNRVFQLLVKPNNAGKAKVLVKSKGADLGLVGTPLLPFDQDPTLTVQVVNSLGECWDASYSAPAMKSDATQFKDSSD
jgi:uncharacterized delta-60 repeat protein